MKVGFIGLGKMGFNISLSLMNKGHDVIGYDINPQLTKKLKENGVKSASSLNELIKLLEVDDNNLYNFYNGLNTNIEFEDNKINNLFKNFKY